jgi:hypothetical protein
MAWAMTKFAFPFEIGVGNGYDHLVMCGVTTPTKPSQNKD